MSPRTVDHQAPLSTDFSRQEYWVGCHFLLQGIFPTQGLNPDLLNGRQMLYPLSHQVTQECSNYCKIALISHASKVMLKILQASLQQYVNCELPDVQAGFRKGRGIRDQIANIRWIIEKAPEFPEKHLLLLYWLHQSLWLCGSPQTVENSERDGNTRPPDLPLEKPICRSGSNS